MINQVNCMKTREFIDTVAAGTLSENDVLEYAANVGNKEALVNDLELVAYGGLLYGAQVAFKEQEQCDRLSRAASVIREHYGIAEPVTAEQQQSLEAFLLNLPDGVGTQRAVKLLRNACLSGLITWNGTGFKRSAISKACLVYFLDRIYSQDASFPAAALETLFGESRLSQALSQLRGNKNGGKPQRGTEQVDALFQEES